MLKQTLLLLFLPLLLFGRQKTYDHLQKHNPPYIPWFTGSVFPPAAVNAPPNHPVIATIALFTVTYGTYSDNWKFQGTDNTYAFNPYLEFLFGLTDHIGVDMYASMISNHKKGESFTHLQDTIVLLGFQIARDKPKTWIPDIRLTLQETLPTGKYEKLNPKKMSIDSTGQGSYQTGFNLITQKLFPFQNTFLLLKWTLTYLFPSPVHVQGYNTYGGGKGTSGKVYPGQTLYLYFSGEYSFTQHWAFAFDMDFQYQQKSTFSGDPGQTDGIPNAVGTLPLVQMSFSPQIEYNFSDHSGLLFGLWATLFGRNSPAFASFIAAYYYAF